MRDELHRYFDHALAKDHEPPSLPGRASGHLELAASEPPADVRELLGNAGKLESVSAPLRKLVEMLSEERGPSV